VLGEGWLAGDDVGPTGSPTQSVWTGDDQPGPVVFTSHDQFVSAVADAARAAGTTNAPVSVTVAQAILESNWGQSLLSREANYYFGIKATGQLGNVGAVWMPTLEVGEAGPYRVLAAFRAYKSLADSWLTTGACFETSACTARPYRSCPIPTNLPAALPRLATARTRAMRPS